MKNLLISKMSDIGNHPLINIIIPVRFVLTLYAALKELIHGMILR